MKMKNLIAIVASTVALTSTVASADLTFVTFRGYEVFRLQNGVVDTGTSSLRVVGAHTLDADAGLIYGSSPDDDKLYTISGAGQLNPQFTNPIQLDRPYQGLTMIGDVFYAFTGSYLAKIDPNDGYSETLVGNTGKGNIGGAAYDSFTDTLYMISNVENTLYTVSKIDGTATAIGTGLGVNSLAAGAEFVDGVLYAAINNADTNMLEFGTIDLDTGVFTMTKILGDGAVMTATSLAIIPSPATGVLIFLGSMTLLWRRRRFDTTRKSGFANAAVLGTAAIMITGASAPADIVTYTNDYNGLGAQAEFTLLNPTTLIIRLTNTSANVPDYFDNSDQLLTSVSWDFGDLGVEILGGNVVIGDNSYSVNFDTGDYFAGDDVSGEWGYGNGGSTGLLPFFLTAMEANSTAFGGPNLDGTIELDGPQGGLVADPILIDLGGMGAIQNEIVATLSLSGDVTSLSFLQAGVIFEWGSDAFITPMPGSLALFGLGGLVAVRRRSRAIA